MATKPIVGTPVQYLAKTLTAPVAAVITEVVDGDTVHLTVFKTARSFPVFNVSRTPSTPVQHYWREIPNA